MGMHFCRRSKGALVLGTIFCGWALFSTRSVAAVAPYPQSEVITDIAWDFSTVTTLREAVGSDLWPLTWAADGNLYGAWGDGGGFQGADRVGRVSLGWARISGFPMAANPPAIVGQNTWGLAPEYAETAATFGGKVFTEISVGGVIYAYGGLWTRANTPDPVHRYASGPWSTLIWSADLAKTWQVASWTNYTLGTFLQFGKDYAGALDSYVYTYYHRTHDSNHLYLRRVQKNQLTADPGEVGVYQYLTGVDARGTATGWSTLEVNAGAVFFDPNGTDAEVVYDAPIGRFLLTSGHNPGAEDATMSAGQVGIFEAPHPWGPWATVGYYDDWGNLGPESFGDYLGLHLPTKWMSADGQTLWAVFSSVGKYDAFHVVKATLRVNVGVPQLTAPPLDTALQPNAVVTARATAWPQSWSLDWVNDTHSHIASGRGASFTFKVPQGGVAGGLIRVTAIGSAGSVYHDYSIAAADAKTAITANSN
jgi:hypothetical protein